MALSNSTIAAQNAAIAANGNTVAIQSESNAIKNAIPLTKALAFAKRLLFNIVNTFYQLS